MKRFIDVDESIITLNAHMERVISGSEVDEIVAKIYRLGFEHAADVLRKYVPSYEPSEIAKLIPHAERDNAAEERCNGSKEARRGQINEYISREAAKQALKPLVHEEDDYADGLHFSDIWEEECDALDALPAADVVPVVHAHWVEQSPDFDLCGVAYYKCSNPRCGKEQQRQTHYCSFCGAKMDERSENEPL